MPHQNIVSFLGRAEAAGCRKYEEEGKAEEEERKLSQI